MFDHIPPVAIKDNDNVKLFLNEIASTMEFGNRLCITFEHKASSAILMGIDNIYLVYHVKSLMFTPAICSIIF